MSAPHAQLLGSTPTVNYSMASASASRMGRLRRPFGPAGSSSPTPATRQPLRSVADASASAPAEAKPQKQKQQKPQKQEQQQQQGGGKAAEEAITPKSVDFSKW